MWAEQRETLSTWVTAVLLLLLLTWYFHLAHTSNHRPLNQASLLIYLVAQRQVKAVNPQDHKEWNTNAADERSN